MKTVLVTGGCGFIGSHFVHLLLARTDWKVVNLDALTYAGTLENLRDVEPGKRYRFVMGDITDGPLVDQVFWTKYLRRKGRKRWLTSPPKPTLTEAFWIPPRSSRPTS